MPSAKKPKKAPARRRARASATPEDAIARGIRNARRSRGWTQQDLADRLAEIGYPLDRSTLAKLEATKKPRGISVNDALAISAALGIAPVHLFTGLGDDDITIGENLSASAVRVRWWIRGKSLLPGAPGIASEESHFFRKEVPPSEAAARETPLARFVEELEDGMVDLSEALFGAELSRERLDELREAAQLTAEAARIGARKMVRDLERRLDDQT
jgi:transcriptional regulator with XRE-family HTH domain